MHAAPTRASEPARSETADKPDARKRSRLKDEGKQSRGNNDRGRVRQNRRSPGSAESVGKDAPVQRLVPQTITYPEALRTFGGNPTDDLILLPFLTLYRQAFELQLKNTIRALVTFRAMYHEGWTFELKKSISAERFRDSNHLGHNLYRLLAEAKKHFAALNLPEKFPKSLETIVLEFHEADKSGTAFRYAGYLPDTQEYTDFPDLVKKLDEVFDLLLAVVDYAEDHYKSMPTLNES